MRQTVVFKLQEALAAVAVEWTDTAAPLDSAAGWQACAAPARVAGGGQLRRRQGARAGAGWPALSPGSRRALVAGVAGPQGVTIPAQPPVPPFLLLAPALAGTGKVGAEVVVIPGAWGGVPAPELALQWCRDGAEIPGAAGPVYVPGAADDLTQLTCRVRGASVAGSATAETAALAITHVAPEPVGTILEEVYDQHSEMQAVEAKGYFKGEALRFTVTGAGASVDALSGVIGIPTEVALSDTVTVTAQNSGGSARQSFPVTVEEAVEIPDPPAALTAGAWDVYWDVDPTQDGVRATWHFAIKGGPALAATRLFWRGLATLDGAEPGAGFHACIPHPSRANHWIARAGLGTVKDWLWVNSPDPAYFVVGQKLPHIAIYTCDALSVAAESALYSPVSNLVEKVVVLEGGRPIRSRRPPPGACRSSFRARPASPATSRPTPCSNGTRSTGASAIRTSSTGCRTPAASGCRATTAGHGTCRPATG